MIDVKNRKGKYYDSMELNFTVFLSVVTIE
jgi:hypothetical protein